MRSETLITIPLLCVLFTLFKDVYVMDNSAANRDNYGPFVARWHHYEICRGPKSKNVTIFETELLNDGETYGAHFNFTFLVNARFDEIKILTYNVKPGKKNTPLWSYKLDNPCQHLVMGALLKSRFGVENCSLKKGFYHTYVNFTTLARDFFGTSFFYGEYLFKCTITSKLGNIGCLNFNAVFSKKE